MDKLTEQIASGENVLEKLMRKIPGFEGYKNREQSRNADKIQRTFMAKSLTTEKGKLADVGQEMVRNGNIMLMADMDRATKLMDKVIDRIEHATYGYSGLFDSVKVDETVLETLYNYDLEMINSISAVAEGIAALENSMNMDEGDPKTRLRDLERSVKNLNEKIDGREKLLKGVE